MRRPPSGWAGAWRISKLRRTWYDTQNGALGARNLALSQDGTGWRVGPIHTSRPSWFPDPAWSEPSFASPDAALGEKIESALLPILVLEGECWLAGANANDVVLSVVTGRWQTLTAQRPSCRLRLTGAPASVIAAVETLAEAYPLSVPLCGLHSAAMAFACGEHTRAEAPGPRIAVPRLTTSVSAEDCFVAIVAQLTEALVVWANAIPPGHHPEEPREPVHQMRVALRRLRSAVRAFAAFISCPAIATLNQKLKELGQALGRARDWDVFLSQTLTAVITALPAEASLLRLRRAALQARRSAYHELHAYFTDRRFARLSIALAGMTVSQPWAETADDLLRERQLTPLKDFAPRILHRKWKKMCRAGDDILNLPPQELHALRLRGKQLRYLTEFFGPLFGGKACDHFIRRLARLQERLGSLNDGAVANGLMAALPPSTRRGQGIVQGFIAGRAGDARQAINETWQRLVHQDEFWQ